MLKRAFLLAGWGWAVLALWSCENRGSGEGLHPRDLALAFAPLALGWGAAKAMRFIVTGSLRSAPRARVVFDASTARRSRR